MIYTFENGTISMTENSARILQNINPITKKPFKDENDALEWLIKHLSYLGKYVDLSFNNEKLQSTFKNTKDIEFDGVKAHIRNMVDDETVYDNDITKDGMTTFNIPTDIEGGEYYVDFKFPNAFCLINKTNAIIKKNNKKKN